MEEKQHLQIRFFDRIKQAVPSGVSLVDDVSEVLNISNDSVYRRLRNETSITVDEVATLCNHYGISFDLFAKNSDTIAFGYDEMGSASGFKHYLESLLDDMRRIKKAENGQIIWAAIDVPIFHHFNYPLLSAFKMFYWMKAIVDVPFLAKEKFSPKLISEELSNLGKQIYKTYCEIPVIEIWTDETINGLLKQIEFFWDSGNFNSKEDAIAVCEDAKNELNTIMKQAEMSNQLLTGNEKGKTNYKMYQCDIEIGNNCIFTRQTDIETVYLSVHTFNKIKTTNKTFVGQTNVWLDNLMKKSTLISGVSQKNRYRFFKKAKQKIERLYNKIESEG